MNNVQQSVRFNHPPERLFDIYTDSRKHSEATGSEASVSRKVGARFTAFGRQIRGRNLLVVPNRMIVQTWRASHWKKTDADSILVLRFSKAPGGGRIDLVHANLPDHDFAGVREGWPKFYWKPWRAYLGRRQDETA